MDWVAVAVNPPGARRTSVAWLLRRALAVSATSCLVVPTAISQTPIRSAASAAYSTLAGAFAALRRNDYDAAIVGFTRTLELTPARNDVRKNLAYTYFKVGKSELARREFEEIVRRDSSDETAALELAFNDYDSPSTEQKADAYRLFARLRSARNPGIRSRAAIAFASADTALALRMTQWYHAMRTEPENPLFSIQFARAAEERGLTRLAEEYYRGSVANGPTAWLDIARLLRAQGRIREAEAAEETAQRTARGLNPFIAERVREDQASRRGDAARPGPLPIPAARAPATGYTIVGGSDGSWPTVLGAGGFTSAVRRDARLIVLRPDSALAGSDWGSTVRAGAFLILEGTSPVATSFGFASTGDSVDDRVELDVHASEQTILWEHALRLPRVRVPAGATIFSRERWSGAPLVAGYRIGAGGVLWLASNAGPKGFERFPYVLSALADLGMSPAVRGREIQTFLDWSYRTRADPEYLAHRWRQMGIGTVHLSAWYFFERDPQRDRLLKALIDACHRNGVIVYAWFELPHVSEQFWSAHPEWREKNALLQDAAIYWRKNINLANPSAFKAVAGGMTDMLMRFDWDGATISELYFEGPTGLANLAEVTPLNEDVRREVRARYGFDPADLFDPSSPRYYSRNARALRQFQDYRVDLQFRLHVQFLDVLAAVRRRKGTFGIAICYLDDVFEPTMRELIGADARRLLPLLPKYDFTFIPEDSYVSWSLGPERYGRMAEQYAALTPYTNKLSMDVNIVVRPWLAFPTAQQTGTEFLQLVNVVQRSFRTVMLYAENSIMEADAQLLPSASASVTALQIEPNRMTVDSKHGVGVRWKGAALVDGAMWPYTDGRYVWVPSGQHELTRPPRNARAPHTHLVDFNGELDALALTPRGLDVSYTADGRAIAVLDRRPISVRVDGQLVTPPLLTRPGATVVMLPGGKHRVAIVTR